ncbi:MAG: hypothetical protein ACRDYZ_02280 [Acidimicrobiales bacterium]
MATRDGLVYGVGALRAAARGDRMMWALHRAALTYGIVPIVPVVVIAEAIRTEPRGDRIEALLGGAEIEPFGSEGARRVGDLAARSGSADLVAVATTEVAVRHNAAVINTRQAALRAAAELLGHELVQYGV